MTVQWTVRAANDRSRDRAARLKSLQAGQKKASTLSVLFSIKFTKVKYFI